MSQIESDKADKCEIMCVKITILQQALQLYILGHDSYSYFLSTKQLTASHCIEFVKIQNESCYMKCYVLCIC